MKAANLRRFQGCLMHRYGCEFLMPLPYQARHIALRPIVKSPLFLWDGVKNGRTKRVS
jgi:hypothetical protein